MTSEYQRLSDRVNKGAAPEVLLRADSWSDDEADAQTFAAPRLLMRQPAKRDRVYLAIWRELVAQRVYWAPWEAIVAAKLTRRTRFYVDQWLECMLERARTDQDAPKRRRIETAHLRDKPEVAVMKCESPVKAMQFLEVLVGKPDYADPRFAMWDDFNRWVRCRSPSEALAARRLRARPKPDEVPEVVTREKRVLKAMLYWIAGSFEEQQKRWADFVREDANKQERFDECLADIRVKASRVALNTTISPGVLPSIREQVVANTRLALTAWREYWAQHSDWAPFYENAQSSPAAQLHYREFVARLDDYRRQVASARKRDIQDLALRRIGDYLTFFDEAVQLAQQRLPELDTFSLKAHWELPGVELREFLDKLVPVEAPSAAEAPLLQAWSDEVSTHLYRYMLKQLYEMQRDHRGRSTALQSLVVEKIGVFETSLTSHALDEFIAHTSETQDVARTIAEAEEQAQRELEFEQVRQEVALWQARILDGNRTADAIRLEQAKTILFGRSTFDAVKGLDDDTVSSGWLEGVFNPIVYDEMDAPSNSVFTRITKATERAEGQVRVHDIAKALLLQHEYQLHASAILPQPSTPPS